VLPGRAAASRRLSGFCVRTERRPEGHAPPRSLKTGHSAPLCSGPGLHRRVLFCPLLCATRGRSRRSRLFPDQSLASRPGLPSRTAWAPWLTRRIRSLVSVGNLQSRLGPHPNSSRRAARSSLAVALLEPRVGQTSVPAPSLFLAVGSCSPSNSYYTRPGGKIRKPWRAPSSAYRTNP